MASLKIVVLSAAATLLAVFALILPAVYNLDPTGVGARLGLIGSAGKPAAAKPVIPEAVPPPGLPEQRSEAFTLEAPPRQTLRFRFVMERDFELDYRWAASDAALLMELQGAKPNGESRVFGKLRAKKGKGFFIAPFNGEFALQWQNTTDRPITVKLTMKGYFETPPQAKTGRQP